MLCHQIVLFLALLINVQRTMSRGQGTMMIPKIHITFVSSVSAEIYINCKHIRYILGRHTESVLLIFVIGINSGKLFGSGSLTGNHRRGCETMTQVARGSSYEM